MNKENTVLAIKWLEEEQELVFHMGNWFKEVGSCKRIMSANLADLNYYFQYLSERGNWCGSSACLAGTIVVNMIREGMIKTCIWYEIKYKACDFLDLKRHHSYILFTDASAYDPKKTELEFVTKEEVINTLKALVGCKDPEAAFESFSHGLGGRGHTLIDHVGFVNASTEV